MPGAVLGLYLVDVLLAPVSVAGLRGLRLISSDGSVSMLCPIFYLYILNLYTLNIFVTLSWTAIFCLHPCKLVKLGVTEEKTGSEKWLLGSPSGPGALSP